MAENYEIYKYSVVTRSLKNYRFSYSKIAKERDERESKQIDEILNLTPESTRQLIEASERYSSAANLQADSKEEYLEEESWYEESLQKESQDSVRREVTESNSAAQAKAEPVMESETSLSAEKSADSSPAADGVEESYEGNMRQAAEDTFAEAKQPAGNPSMHGLEETIPEEIPEDTLSESMEEDAEEESGKKKLKKRGKSRLKKINFAVYEENEEYLTMQQEEQRLDELINADGYYNEILPPDHGEKVTEKVERNYKMIIPAAALILIGILALVLTM